MYHIIFSKTCHYQTKQDILNILGMKEWVNPGKYLGLTVDWGRYKKLMLKEICDKIISKTKGWREKFLSQAGKEILIKSVLQAIPTYAMSILKFPKSLCKNMSSHLAKFWWASTNKEKWSNMTVSKEYGDLGFKDFNIMNLALLAKQAWRLANNPNTLWSKILKDKYFPEGNLWNAKTRQGASWAWASILEGRDLLLQHGRWQIGDGKDVGIFKDNWMGYRLTSLCAPTLPPDDTVISIINQQTKA